MAPLGFSLLLLLSLAFSPSPSLSYEPRNPEVEALIGIRQALNDPRGVLNNWDEFSVDPCSWAMVTCSSENLVIGLGAPSQSLSGTLSGFIGNLTNLKQVLLQNNNIIGEIPPELGRLPKLQTLDLSNNRLSGSVPEAVGLINSLQYLRLNNNSLSGVIPVSLATVPQLAFLDLSYNDLSGRVPKISARTFNIVGNPLICGAGPLDSCSGSTPLLPFSSNTSPGKSRGRKLAIALGVSVSVASLLFIALGFLLWLRKSHQKQAITNTNDKQEEGLISLGNLRIFSLRELQLATNNFSSKSILGSGGFGNVYKGKLGDGMIVAVKRLNDMTGITGESQFRTELEMISLAVHRNLLRLIGYCATPNERLLVYPYMSNGSVASRLRGKPALDWDARKRIAIGAARGLMYLHEQCDPKIIHRDVKAANVLLDEYCEAVVGDFGLAKLLDHAESHVTTAVRGTFGHIAPEYLSTGQSSEKTDVFGFGILLLELISGMRALEFGKTVNQKGAMLEWVRKVQQEKVEMFVDRELRSQYDQIEAGEMLQVALLCTQYLPAHCPKISELLRKIHQENKVEVLVDRELGSNYDRIEAGEMLQVALLCTQYLPAHRPKMSEVVRMLEGDGLVEKWAAAHSHSNNNNNLGMSFSHPNNNSDNNKSCLCPTGSTRHEEDNEHDNASMLCGANVEDDIHSLDVYAIELSGPR